MTNDPIIPNDNIDFNQPTPSSFLDDLRNKKTEAWERLLMLYGRMILYWLDKAGIPREERQDVLLDVCIQVMNSIHNFQHKDYVGSFRSWLRKVVENHIHNLQKKYKEQTGCHGVYEPDSSLIEAPNSSVLESIIKQEEEEEKNRQPSSNSPYQIDEDALFAKGLMQVLGTQFSQRDISIYFQLVYEKKNAAQVAELMGLTSSNVRKIKERINKYLKENYGDLKEDLDADEDK